MHLIGKKRLGGNIGRLRRLLRYSYRVPWAVPAWGWPELGATLLCAMSGRLRRGPYVERFKETLQRHLGVRYAVPVNRGRTAIELGLRALGVGPGDDVVVPAYVCESVVEAIERAGARPVFADVGPDLHAGVGEVMAALTPATRCVIAVHLFGGAAPVDELEKALAGTGIALIDDAAQALGLSIGGRRIGTFGTCGIVSCGPGKPLSGVAGGCLVTNDPELYARAAAIELGHEPPLRVLARTIGWWFWRRWRRFTLPLRVMLDRLLHRPPSEKEPEFEPARLANLDAAIALRQLERLEAHTAKRRANARRLLEQMPALRPWVAQSPETGLAIKLIVVLPPEGPTIEQAIERLAALGLECQQGYRPIHRAYASHLPVTDSIWSRVLCLPVDSPWTPPSRMDAGWPLVETAMESVGGATAAVS